MWNVYPCAFGTVIYMFTFADSAEPKKKKFKMMSDDGASAIKVAIDFGFEDLMTDKV